MKFIYLCIFLLYSTYLFSLNSDKTKKEENKCERFRTGQFENVCKSGHQSKFKRYKTYQVQEYRSFTLKESIQWTGPCSYITTLLETTDPEIMDYIGNSMKVKMVKVEKDKYQTIEEGSSGSISTCIEKKVNEL